MRYETVQPGIRSRHEFSFGAHYDPSNVSFGPIVGLDEHVVAPAAGFDWHDHRGVHIVSWVLDGVLRHEDSAGARRFVEPGVALVQSTGDGVSHTETNASDVEVLRFVQLTILGGSAPGVSVVEPPLTVGEVSVDVVDEFSDLVAARTLVCVVRGAFRNEGVDPYGPGDVARLGPGDSLHLDGRGELLVVTLAD